MEARLSAAQQALLLLLVASLALAVAARPHPDNRRYLRALDEVVSFREGFHRADVEKSLADHARSQEPLPLATLVEQANALGEPKLALAEGAEPLRPLANATLATMADVRKHALHGSTLTIGLPDAAQLAASISWRLSRLGTPGPFSLTSAELRGATLSQQDIARETLIAQLRGDVAKAESGVQEATKKLDIAERIFEARRKRHLPWTELVDFNEARKTARTTLEERKASLTSLEEQYRAETKQAQSVRPSTAGSAPKFALAAVTLSEGASPQTLLIPVALTQREVAVPTLSAGSFAATQEAGLWDEVKTLSPDGAIEAIRGHFNWHNRYLGVGSARIGGMIVLQILPCILLLLFGLLLKRLHVAATSYSPFTTKVSGALPRVGFGSRTFDFIALVVMPFLSASSAAISLLLIDRLPLFPALAAAGCLVLGLYAFWKLGELQDMIVSVIHSHSYPPQD